jgi:hypothetical protein
MSFFIDETGLRDEVIAGVTATTVHPVDVDGVPTFPNDAFLAPSKAYINGIVGSSGPNVGWEVQATGDGQKAVTISVRRRRLSARL